MTNLESPGASLLRVNAGIGRLLGAIDPDIFDAAGVPFNMMGKAVRTRFSVLLGDALGLARALAEGVGETAELTHTASLLHDDCVDKASLRRGVPTINASLGVNRAILVGDLIVALAFERAYGVSTGAARELVSAVRRMTEGALLEENSSGLPLGTEDLYRITALKTGSLFGWCALSLAHLAGQPSLFGPCSRLGEETGISFQLVDDALDFECAASASGKEALRDIFCGRHTLPLVLALEDKTCGPELKRVLEAFRAGGSRDADAAAKAADMVLGGGFAAAARSAARLRAQTSIFPLIALLPDKEGAARLGDFINALLERTA